MQPKICFALIKLDLENCPLLRTQVFLWTDKNPQVVRQRGWLPLALHRR